MAANPGRVRTAPIDIKAFSLVVVDLVGIEDDVTGWFPYSQTKSRRVPIWSELWRLRASTHEFLSASAGFMHCQKDVERTFRLSHAEVVKSAGKRAVCMDDDDVEAATYRIRAIMMHARNTHAGMWKFPTRFS